MHLSFTCFNFFKFLDLPWRSYNLPPVRLSVRPSVRLSVSNPKLQELDHRTFLISCMKLGDHKCFIFIFYFFNFYLSEFLSFSPSVLLILHSSFKQGRSIVIRTDWTDWTDWTEWTDWTDRTGHNSPKNDEMVISWKFHTNLFIFKQI